MKHISITEIEKQIDADFTNALREFDPEKMADMLVPEKLNWDLKRDLRRNQLILAPRTEEALQTLIMMQDEVLLKGEHAE